MTAQIMIDIETLSTSTNAAIASIAAVAFDFNKGVLSEFAMDIDVTDSIQSGGHVCGETLKWISKSQSIDIADFVKGQTPIAEALNSLIDWMKSFDSYVVWANSPSFDLTIIRTTASRLNINIPWKYYHERDYRTFVYLAETFGFNSKYQPQNASHNALEDATNQAYVVIDAFNYMFDLKNKSDDKDLNSLVIK